MRPIMAGVYLMFVDTLRRRTGNLTHSQVCSIMLVKTTQYKSSGISSANLLWALKFFDLPPAISPELNKCPGSNPVFNLLAYVY